MSKTILTSVQFKHVVKEPRPGGDVKNAISSIATPNTLLELDHELNRVRCCQTINGETYTRYYPMGNVTGYDELVLPAKAADIKPAK